MLFKAADIKCMDAYNMTNANKTVADLFEIQDDGYNSTESVNGLCYLQCLASDLGMVGEKC